MRGEEENTLGALTADYNVPQDCECALSKCLTQRAVGPNAFWYRFWRWEKRPEVCERKDATVFDEPADYPSQPRRAVGASGPTWQPSCPGHAL